MYFFLLGPLLEPLTDFFPLYIEFLIVTDYMIELGKVNANTTQLDLEDYKLWVARRLRLSSLSRNILQGPN